MINEVYDKLDEDGSGGLTFEEFQQGMMRMIRFFFIVIVIVIVIVFVLRLWVGLRSSYSSLGLFWCDVGLFHR